jgi:hypothetical protein
MRLTPLAVSAIVGAALLAGCGSQAAQPQARSGSAGNPLVGKPSQPGADGRTNEATTDAGQSAEAQTSAGIASGRQAPCRLVGRAQARAILGAAVRAPLQAPQGPTCIYRTRHGHGYVTLAVQPLELSSLARRMQKPKRFAVAHRTAYCGVYGQPMLYAAVTRGVVLSIAAPCGVARQFAARALARLES